MAKNEPWRDAEFEKRALELVDGKRRAHVVGCAELAVKLARRLGADERSAWRAGMLHDCTKRLKTDEQLKSCAEYGIIINQSDEESPLVLHAYTAAELSRREFGLSDEECSAIRWHTTGHADMTQLEKAVYLADCIEPTRDYPGVEKLRRLAKEDVEAAVLAAAARTIAHLAEQNRPIHEKTIEMYNDLLRKTRKA